MTALAEALLAAQRQAIGALSKAYVANPDTKLAEPLTVTDLVTNLNAIGCTDTVEQAQLIAALDILIVLGAPSPAATKAEPENEPASERQIAFIARLADDRGVPAPDALLNKAQASQVIEQLKAGTYNPDEWTVPF